MTYQSCFIYLILQITLLKTLNEYMKTGAIDTILRWLSIVVIVSLLFLPPFRIKSSLPAIELVDILVPIIGIILAFRFKAIQPKRFYLIIGIFATHILLTIAVNSRLGEMRDYFELFKLMKFALFAALFSLSGMLEDLKLFKQLFIALVIVNLMQYFNTFNINLLLSDIFPNPERYLYFGLDSAGQLTGKRMLGLAMNPNINAIIFSVFAILFWPRSDHKKRDFIWFFLALTMAFLCQSRTAMVGMVGLILVSSYLNRKHIRLIAVTAGIMVLSFAASFATTKYSTSIVSAPNFMEAQNNLNEGDLSSKVTYLESVIHGEFLEGSSMDGRFEMWTHLWEMIKEKPLLGHAPYKEYFYENHIYSESEYVMMTWRYGFIGLLIYVFIYMYLVVIAIRNIHLSSAKVLLFTVLLMMVVAITNNPFSHQKILIFIAIIVGSFFWELNKSSKNDSIR